MDRIKFVLLVLFLVFQCGLCRIQNLRTRVTNRRACLPPSLPNGQAVLRNRGRMVRYSCPKPYELYGVRYGACYNGRWDNETPFCVRPGCTQPFNLTDGVVLNLQKDAVRKLYCHNGFEVAGNQVTHCNGTNWDRSLGSCRPTTMESQTECDFEVKSLCGWTNDEYHSNDWKISNGAGELAGPHHDHTKMIPYEGFFMVLEGRGGRKLSISRLWSPIFNATMSEDACFRLYYHIYGKKAGTLRVYIIPTDVKFNVLSKTEFKVFEITNSSSNMWREGLFNLQTYNSSFQLAIEGVVGIQQTTNIAIDDVALLKGDDCIVEREATTVEPPEEDKDGFFEVQLCKNRCNETSIPLVNDTLMLHCDCHNDCMELETCCPDYETSCVFGSDDDDGNNEGNDVEVEKATTIMDIPQTTTIQAMVTPSRTTEKPTTVKVTTTTMRTTPATSPTTTTMRPTTTPKTTPSTTTTIYIPTTKRPKVITESDIVYLSTGNTNDDDDDGSDAIDVFKNNTVGSREQMKHEKYGEDETTSSTGGTIAATIMFAIIMTAIILAAGAALVQRYRRNPANYKKNYQGNSTSATDEIRYLTSDEDHLDFGLQTPAD